MEVTYRVLSVILLFAINVAFADERQTVRQRIEALRPAPVSVTAIGFEGERVVVAGHSSNVNAIANFVENVKNDPMFIEPTVMFVRQRSNSSPPVYEFEFGAKCRKSNS